jgi:molybdopterin-dependent oxidoreductase alpha subunit
MSTTTRKVHIVPPADLTGLTLKEPETSAAGVKAITVAMKHIAEETGLLRGFGVLAKLNQRHGFDCPGCAWPEPVHRSKLGEYCENGAKAIAEEATVKKADIEFFNEHSVEEISTWSDYRIGKSGRVVHPMYLPKGKSYYEPISWEKAYSIIADELRACTSPNEAVFYTSGRTSNEAAFLYQLMVRTFGTNNLPDCSNMCHESSGVALSETIGIGKGTVTLEDLYNAEVILVVGQNPGTNHPRMLSALQKCKKNGGVIVHINPLPEAGTSRFVDPQSPVEVIMGGTKLADHFLQVKIGSDLFLFKALLKLLLEEDKKRGGGVLDHAFMEKYTDGGDALLATLESVNLFDMSRHCGISESTMREMAALLASRKKIITCWAMGITQHKHAVNTIREITNMHLLLGAIGMPGAGLCPVRGHSNVQGDRTMGIYEKPKPEFVNALNKHFHIHAPLEQGYDVVESIEAMDKGKVRVFMAMGGNFISATPDSEFTGKAVQKCRLTVQVSTKLCRSHVVTGAHALILPCLGRTEKDSQPSGEQFVSVENSMGVVHSSRGHLIPADHHLKSEPRIVAEIAAALGLETERLPWLAMADNYDLIRDHIEKVIPGFTDYNKRVRHPDGFDLPNGPRQSDFSALGGKAHFTLNPLPDISIRPGHFIMMTIRSHDQYNTTIYGLDDRYRGIENERRVLLMNKNDIEKLGLRAKDLVSLISDADGVMRKAERFHVIPFNIPIGCTASYFPETNCLVPIGSTADKSNTPMSKFIEIRIERW